LYEAYNIFAICLLLSPAMMALLSAQLSFVNTYHCILFAVFTRKSSYCFQRVLAIAILSVCLSVTRVDQSKTVQDRITQFSPSAAQKILVLGTVKLFHKFKGGHSERKR